MTRDAEPAGAAPLPQPVPFRAAVVRVLAEEGLALGEVSPAAVESLLAAAWESTEVSKLWIAFDEGAIVPRDFYAALEHELGRTSTSPELLEIANALRIKAGLGKRRADGGQS